MRWRSMKEEPPYDWTEESDGGTESDPDTGFLCYDGLGRFRRGESADTYVFVSPYPYTYKEGRWWGQTGHVFDPPETVLYWMPVSEVSEALRLALKLKRIERGGGQA